MSSGVEGTVSARLPKDPARLREMKLRRRLRFGVFVGGEGGVGGFEMLGRPASGSTESIDQRDCADASSSTGAGGRSTEVDARGDETEGARDTREGLCAMLCVEVTLMGEAGTPARSASVRSCGDEAEVDKLSVGRDLFRLSRGRNDSTLAFRAACARMVPSGLARPSSSESTRTPLRLADSVSRSSNSDRVDEIDGNAPCECIDRGVPIFVEGGLERGKSCE